jgi:intein-encoded DNA endonuclease-like protein
MSSKVFELSDRAMGGKLSFLLTKWRLEGLSHERIARKLETEHGITVSGRTVANWLDGLKENSNGKKAVAS